MALLHSFLFRTSFSGDHHYEKATSIRTTSKSTSSVIDIVVVVVVDFYGSLSSHLHKIDKLGSENSIFFSLMNIETILIESMYYPFLND